MVSERNRIVNLVKYLESCGITINIAKNKARGHRGYFKAIGDGFRIDIARGLSEDAVLRTLAHEFAHYVHYNYDKTFFPEEFLIIAPNKFFLNYISNVLPDLGVDRVGQSTYEEIAFDVIRK